MTDFIFKYKPNKLKDIIGNVKQINDIEAWLNKYDNNKQIKKSSEKKTKKKKINIKIEKEIIIENIIDVNNDIDIDNVDIDNIDIDIIEDIEDNIIDEIQIKSGKKNSNMENHSCLMIIGDHGVGKTLTVNILLENMGYRIKTFDLSKLGSNKNIMEHINKLTKGNNIYDSINSNIIKSVILIDEIESITSPVEKNFILTLMKLNEEYWYIPIIFISNGKHTKLNMTLKKNTNYINFNQPTKDNLLLLLSNMASKEKMTFENINVGYDIIIYCQNDYRRLILIVQDLKNMYGKKTILQEFVNNYKCISQIKDMDVEIFRCTSQMMTKYCGLDKSYQMYEKEKVILPLMMEQNFVKSMIYCGLKKNKFKTLSDISKIFAFGDLIENYIYSDQNWDMYDVHGFLSCIYPSYKITNEKLNTDENSLKKILDYPCDLNKTSIKKINKKNIINSNVNLPNFEITDFIYANKLIKTLISENKIDECVELFSGYGIKVENIESIIKIDKIDETKHTISSQVRKKFTQLLGSTKSKVKK
jgi:hypothetical protein